jgi:hypothetical protein
MSSMSESVIEALDVAPAAYERATEALRLAEAAARDAGVEVATPVVEELTGASTSSRTTAPSLCDMVEEVEGLDDDAAREVQERYLAGEGGLGRSRMRLAREADGSVRLVLRTAAARTGCGSSYRPTASRRPRSWTPTGWRGP